MIQQTGITILGNWGVKPHFALARVGIETHSFGSTIRDATDGFFGKMVGRRMNNIVTVTDVQYCG
jgi:hypothetical protein